MDDETQIKYALKRPTRGPALITPPHGLTPRLSMRLNTLFILVQPFGRPSFASPRVPWLRTPTTGLFPLVTHI